VRIDGPAGLSCVAWLLHRQGQGQRRPWSTLALRDNALRTGASGATALRGDTARPRQPVRRRLASGRFFWPARLHQRRHHLQGM